MNKEKETHHIWTSGEDWWERVLDDENTRLTRRCDVEHNWAMLSIETFYRDVSNTEILSYCIYSQVYY